MSYTQENFEKANEIMAKRREDAENALLARMEHLAKLDPEYSRVKQTLISTAQQVCGLIGCDEETARKKIEKLRRENLDAQAKLGDILKRNKLTEDYLQPKYTCPVCEDTGSVGRKLCSCMIDVLKKLAIDEEGRKSPLKFCRFEDFSLDYYSEEPSPVLGGKSPKKHMEEVLDFCKEYAMSFDRDSQSLYMYGETGLGKTHLSLAITAELIDKGFSVVYNSAQNILSRLNNIQFGKLDDPTFEPLILECDLLVIDDLGAEFSTTFTQALVYNIINTRMNEGLPTIISTNLPLPEIAERYTQRIASRIIGEYENIYFTGEDIRQQKKNAR